MSNPITVAWINFERVGSYFNLSSHLGDLRNFWHIDFNKIDDYSIISRIRIQYDVESYAKRIDSQNIRMIMNLHIDDRAAKWVTMNKGSKKIKHLSIRQLWIQSDNSYCGDENHQCDAYVKLEKYIYSSLILLMEKKKKNSRWLILQWFDWKISKNFLQESSYQSIRHRIHSEAITLIEKMTWWNLTQIHSMQWRNRKTDIVDLCLCVSEERTYFQYDWYDWYKVLRVSIDDIDSR